MEDCIFCKIVNKEIKSGIIWEDEKHLAFLDKYPNTRGQMLVITKNHYPSNILKLENNVYSDFLLAAKNVADIMIKKLNIYRVGLVCEGMHINHAHIKLYPMHGIMNEFEEIWNDKPVFFEKYSYITTLQGPEITKSELENLLNLFQK